jgi:hypothetical protein
MIKNLIFLSFILFIITTKAQNTWQQEVNYKINVSLNDADHILSAIEKNSPLIHVKNQPTDTDTQEHFIWRSERGMEGEEMVSMLEFGIESNQIQNYLKNCSASHILKLNARISYLQSTIVKGL